MLRELVEVKKFANTTILIMAVFLLMSFYSSPVFALEQTSVSAITEPLNRIYDLVKAIVSILAVIVITFAGVKFMFSGDNLQAREGAKQMLSYAIIGMAVVWVAPALVSYLNA
ncbi:MAG: pilin [Candidatus Diapherotrites archaeon]|nr:pilin [Candidatus Diapherotrites archaeon]